MLTRGAPLTFALAPSTASPSNRGLGCGFQGHGRQRGELVEDVTCRLGVRVEMGLGPRAARIRCRELLEPRGGGRAAVGEGG